MLAKIDALDWDQTVSPNTVMVDNSPTPATAIDDHGSSTAWRVAAIIAGLICVAAVTYYVLVPADRPEAPRDVTVSGGISGSVVRNVDLPATSPEAMKDSLASMAASEERRAERYEQAVRAAEVEEQREAERLRQAREARRAERTKIAAQRERERLQQEEATKARARREAEEAARVREQAAAKGPASPQEACAGEGNFFARGLCETRLCGKPEWQSHPFCVKRMEQQMPGFGPGG